ncbi:uncharacterized protein LOC116806003 [Drosophila grimshawi]|uniref:uncharacterized protein LOC116806003 n=1 Tax=Drosophila grimshawi TaxID=7222 RepID=UPI000C8709C5|nr:uncharacterized protein LOC116806003 [Drosophila grimshawi]
MEAEYNLGEHAQWKEIQQNTFTRWTNEHLKTVGSSLDNLETDLSDGLRLITLAEVLSQKRLPPHNARPTFRVQKLENVSVALTFFQNEGIKIVNIDASNIVDGNLKLIMGLIWTLILHYSISTPIWDDDKEQPPTESVQTPKQRLLTWIQMKIPDMCINNFTKDWTTGKPIGALVDACAPGLCPDWELWNPVESVRNATEAMVLADDWLDVRQLITPAELVDPNVDEQSVMTYLAQYPNCKLKDGAPLRPKTDPNNFPIIEAPIVAVIDPIIESTPAEVFPGVEAVPAELYPGDESYPAEVYPSVDPVPSELLPAESYPGNRPSGPVVGEPAIIIMDTLPIDEADYFTEIGQLYEGATFLFTGLVSLNCDRFSINFVHGNNNRDVALHINPRFFEQRIITNTEIHNKWGREEIPATLPFLLGQGERFAIQVLVTQTCYLIAINGHHLSAYSHRLAYDAVRFLEVKGDVGEVRMHSSMVRGYPQSFFETAIPPHVYFDVLPMYRFADDFAEVGQLDVGDSFTFSGLIPKKSKEFEINFLCNNDTNDVAFHMKSLFSHKRIIRNSKIYNVWGHEEQSTTPYRPGERFAVQVLVTDSCYLIAINGQHYTQYSHRLPYNSVATLEVKGNMQDVQMQRSTVHGYPQYTLKRQIF